MTNNNYSSKRIARNTLMLYIRTGIMMALTLYTTRVLLQQLGVEDYGIFHVMMGVVTLFAFASSSLTIATQRFVSNALGQGGGEKVTKVFAANIYIYLLVVIISIVLFETIGLWYVNYCINVPFERIYASKIVYQLVILQFVFMTFRIPYSSAVIAYERMDFYAYISIFEAVLALGLVYTLSVTNTDKLVLYAALLVATQLVVLFSYIIYCKRYIPCCQLISLKKISKDTFLEIWSFSEWNLFGAFSTTVNFYGVNLIVNYFCGVAVNATIGISNQLTMGIYNLVANLQTAFNPQIYKLYAAKEYETFNTLVFRNSKFCFFLYLLLLVPFFICINDILLLWLGQVPVFSIEVCRCMLIFLSIESLSYPLYVAIQANGFIGKYQQTVGIIYLLFVPLSFLMFLMGFSITTIFIARVFLNIVITIYRLIYLHRIISFDVKSYCQKIISKCLFVLLIVLVLLFIMNELIYVYGGLMRMVIVFSMSLLITPLTIYYIGLTSSERLVIKNIALKAMTKFGLS